MLGQRLRPLLDIVYFYILKLYLPRMSHIINRRTLCMMTCVETPPAEIVHISSPIVC